MDGRFLVIGLAGAMLAGAYVGLSMTSMTEAPEGAQEESSQLAGGEESGLPESNAAQESGPAESNAEGYPQGIQFGSDSEIGKPCSSDSDCLLPYAYAIRSDCPYEMRCSEGRCEVFCPWDKTEDNSTNETTEQDETSPQEKTATLEFFWGIGCPECAAEKDFLSELEGNYSRLEVLTYEVNEDEENLELMMERCGELDIGCGEVPVTIIGGVPYTGFLDAEGEFKYHQQRRMFVGYRNQLEEGVLDALGMISDAPEGWENHVSLSASADKAIYYEKESIEITASVRSRYGVDSCYVRADGLKGYVRDSRFIHLDRGDNRAAFQESAPRCFGCGGFEPGEYPIDVWLEKDGERIDERTLTIEIRDL